MAFGFNPFTGNFDLTGGGDAAPFAGQVDAYADLPLDSTAALNSRWLVKNNFGTWPFSTYKQAGIYIRVSTVGASRDTDYQFVGTLPSVMNDSEFIVYDDTDATKNLKFNVGANVPTASTVTLTAPSASGTIGFLQSVTSITVSSTHQLTAARNQRVLINNTASAGTAAAIFYPNTGNAEGDRLEVVHATQPSGGQPLTVRTASFDFTGSRSISLGEQGTFIYTSGAWTAGSVETHTHSGLGPTFASSAFRVTEPSGLVTNSLAFSLSGITAGSTRTLTVPDASGRIQIEGQAIGNTTAAAGTFTTLTANNGTINASAPALNVQQTWNGAGVNFVAAEIAVTRTQSSNDAEWLRYSENGSPVMFFRRTGQIVASQITLTGTGGTVVVSSNLCLGATSNGAFLNNDGANHTLAQRNGTNAQESRIYGTFTSATNYQRLAIKTKAVTLSNLSGASVATTTGFIPDGAVLVGLTTRVSTAITGATGYDIGDGSDADRWGANVGIALNTSSDNTNWTAGTIECFTAAQEVTLTAVGNNFTGGAVVIVAHYLAGEAD